MEGNTCSYRQFTYQEILKSTVYCTKQRENLHYRVEHHLHIDISAIKELID